MINKKHYKEALSYIENATNILLCTHKKPDGDAIGSMSALSLFLTSQKKQVHAYTDELPEQLHFIPASNTIKTKQVPQDIIDVIDLVIIMDFNDFKRYYTPEILEHLHKNNIPFIIIDHHHQFSTYDHCLYLTNEDASSTTTILYDFLTNIEATITAEIATCLLTGILTDTGNFINSATNTESLKYSSDLLLKGAHINEINEHTTYNKNINVCKLWGGLLKNLKYNPEYKIAYTIVLQRDLDILELTHESYQSLSNFLTCIDGINAVMVLSQQEDGTVKGSLRSINPHINVAKIAKLCGGGGHIKAAGFTIDGTLVQTHTGWQIH